MLGEQSSIEWMVLTGYGEDIVARVWTETDDALGVRHGGYLVDQLQVREAVHVHLIAQHHHYAVSAQLNRKHCELSVQ